MPFGAGRHRAGAMRFSQIQDKDNININNKDNINNKGFRVWVSGVLVWPARGRQPQVFFEAQTQILGLWGARLARAGAAAPGFFEARADRRGFFVAEKA